MPSPETPADTIRRAAALIRQRGCSQGDCDRKHYARGLCQMHWQRLYRTGATTLAPPPTSRERFLAKVEKTASCWNWTAHVDSVTGYGHFNLDGRVRGAHCAAYELFVGPIPNGLELDHKCRNRICVNPDRLEPVTQHVNNLRGKGFAAINAAKTHCVHGHPFDAANTYILAGGGRRCRACSRASRQRRVRASSVTLAAARAFLGEVPDVA